MKTIEIRPHKCIVLSFVYPYLSLLFIPLIRGISNYGKGGALSSFLIGESIVALIVAVIAILKWHRFHCLISEDAVTIKKGLFYRVEFNIPTEKIGIIALDKSPLLSFVGARGLKIYTESGNSKKATVDIPIKISDANNVNALYYDQTPKKIYHCHLVETIILSATVSSAATGLLIAAPIISQTGKLIGASLSDMILAEITKVSERLPSIIPTAASVISIVLLAGYMISFVNAFLRNINFEIFKNNDTLVVDAGVFPHRTIMLDIKDIQAVSIIQNPVMQLLRHYTVKMSISGYGKSKNEVSVLLPAVTKREINNFLDEFLPEWKNNDIDNRPPASSIRRFIIPPVVLILAAFPAQWILGRYYPQFSDLFLFLAYVLIGISFIWGATRIRQFVRGGISFGDTITMISGRYLSLVELRVKQDNVEYFRVFRYPQDYLSGLCRLKIAVRSKNGDRLFFISLNYKNFRKKLLSKYHIID